jgi:hypothetical protein
MLHDKARDQDYYDGLGRKVITLRRNPDGQAAYQVSHYDKMGNADAASNWSFIAPPGIGAWSCADAALDNPAVQCPAIDPSQWTDGNLLNYITLTVGNYSRSCRQVWRVSHHG